MLWATGLPASPVSFCDADHVRLFEGEESALHVMSFWTDAPEVPHPPPDPDGNSGFVC